MKRKIKELTEERKFVDLVEAFVLQNHGHFDSVSYKGKISFHGGSGWISRKQFTVTKEKLTVYRKDYEWLVIMIQDKFEIPIITKMYEKK